MQLRVWAAGVLLCGFSSGHRVCADAAPPLSAYEEPRSLSASIYARGVAPPQLLFKFRRTASPSGSMLHVLREYTYPDGRVAARERVTYEGDALRSYTLEELQTSSVGEVSATPSAESGRIQLKFEFSKDTRRASTRTTRESVNNGVLVNDMMGVFISNNFERLSRGARLSCRYIVVSRRETVGLSFVKEGETLYHGRPAVLLKVQPASPLISVLVDPLHFIVEKDPPHHVLEYTGLTTPKVLEGGHWKDLEAVTVFDW